MVLTVDLMSDEALKQRLQERDDAIVIVPETSGGFGAYVVPRLSLKVTLDDVQGRASAPCPVVAAKVAMQRAEDE